MNRALIIAGTVVLLAAWVGPLPALASRSFAAHMLLHMSVVGIGVPLLAIGLAPRLRMSGAVLVWPIMVSVLDLIVVWGWHAPYLHYLSRSEPLMLALEQASFAGAALLVWLIAFSGPPLAGAMTLFFTSMHMTLLGALIGLATRPIYPRHDHGSGWLGLSAIDDQHVGGVVMLAIGGVVYLAGGLLLAARALRPRGAT